MFLIFTKRCAESGRSAPRIATRIGSRGPASSWWRGVSAFARIHSKGKRRHPTGTEGLGDSLKDKNNMRENSSGNLSLIMASHGLVHILFISLAALLPLIRLEFGLSYTQIGVFTFALSVIAAVASIPMGFISDRVNKLRLISSMFFLVAIVASFFVVVRSLTFVLLLLSFLWLCLSVFHPSSMAYLSSRYPSKRGEIFGLYELGASLGMIVAPVIAVWVASIWGWKSVYGVYVLPAIFVALGTYRIAGREVPSHQNGQSRLREEFLHGLKGILVHRRLKFIYLVSGLSAVIYGGVSLYLPISMVDVHGFDVPQAGYILTLFSLEAPWVG